MIADKITFKKNGDVVYVLPGYYLFCPAGSFPAGFSFPVSSCPWPGFEELPGHDPGSPSHVGVILAYAGVFTNAAASIKAAVTATMVAIANVLERISTLLVLFSIRRSHGILL
jgi:hypothetical protein